MPIHESLYEYTVTWTIEVQAKDPVDAARRAEAIIREGGRWNRAFDVYNSVGDDFHIDLAVEGEGGS